MRYSTALEDEMAGQDIEVKDHDSPECVEQEIWLGWRPHSLLVDRATLYTLRMVKSAPLEWDEN